MLSRRVSSGGGPRDGAPRRVPIDPDAPASPARNLPLSLPLLLLFLVLPLLPLFPLSAATPDLIIWADTVNPAIAERNYNTNTCEVIEGCAQAGPRRYLLFGTETRNIGAGDLVVGDPRFNTNFTFVTCHGHYHFDAFADYRLVGSGGVPVAVGNKVGFCLRDSGRFSASAASVPRYNCDYQGIQAGWADIYDASLPCQWVDVTGVPAGLYVLELEVNPEGRLVETSRSNNLTRIQIALDDPCTGPPANDSFSSPLLVTRRAESVFSSTACATREAGEQNHTGRNVTNTVWFRWTAPAGGNVVMTTEGSTFNTLLAVYRGTNIANLTTVATSNDDGDRTTSRVSFNATSNVTYQIVVAGLANAPGGVALNINPAGNDAFASRSPLNGATGSIAGLSVTATREAREPAHAGITGSNSVWFSWRAPATGPVRFDTAGSNFDTVLAAYTGSQLTNLAPIAADNDSGPGRTSRLAFHALAGSNYVIAVDAMSGAAGFFRLNWGPPAPPRFESIVSLPGGGVQLQLLGAPGLAYDVEASPDLDGWTFWTRITNRTGITPLLDPATNNAPRRFYRALSPP